MQSPQVPLSYRERGLHLVPTKDQQEPEASRWQALRAMTDVRNDLSGFRVSWIFLRLCGLMKEIGKPTMGIQATNKASTSNHLRFTHV